MAEIHHNTHKKKTSLALPVVSYLHKQCRRFRECAAGRRVVSEEIKGDRPSDVVVVAVVCLSVPGIPTSRKASVFKGENPRFNDRSLLDVEGKRGRGRWRNEKKAKINKRRVDDEGCRGTKRMSRMQKETRRGRGSGRTVEDDEDAEGMKIGRGWGQRRELR